MPLGGLTDEIDFKVFRSHVKIPLIFLVPAAFVVTLYASVYMYANSSWFLDELTSTLHAQMGGHFQVKELVVDATLTNVRLYDVAMQTPDRRPVIDADEVFASIEPVVLLSQRLLFDEAVVRGAHVRIEFGDDGQLRLLQALGVDRDDPPEEDDEDSKGSLAVEFADIEIQDSKFTFQNPGFRFHAPSLDIPQASITIGPESLRMSVDRFDVPQIDFVFENELMRLPEEQGDWKFRVENARLRKWRWSNDGFDVESIALETEGVALEAQGQMAFPGGEDEDAPTMTYDASASLSVAYWSPLAQYFLDDAVHFEVPEIRVAAKGSLDEIDGAAKLHASHLETAGLHFEDVRATVALANQWLDIAEASAKVHGGRVEIPQAFFNIFSIQYGAKGRFEGVNPRSLLNDFDADLPFLDGRLSGGFELTGGVPRYPDEPSSQSLYGLRDFAQTKYADVKITEDWVLERGNLPKTPQMLAPAARITLQKGASTWVDADRVVIPRARLRLDEDTLLVDDFRFAYRDRVFEKGPDNQPTQLSAFLSDLGAWASLYGVEDVEGPVMLNVSAFGPLASPSLSAELRNRDAPLQFPGTNVAADKLRLRVGLAGGRLSIHDASVSTRLGDASLSGWIDLLLADPNAQGAAPEGERSAFALRRIQPANLTFSADRVDVGAIAGLAGLGVPVQGELSARGKLDGTLQDPNATLEADIRRGQVLGQAISQVHLEAGMRDRSVVVDTLQVDAAGAGKLSATGRYGFDGGYDFDLDAKDISLSQIEVLEILPSSVQPRGRARLRLHGEGTVDEPSVGGDLQLYEFNVGERKLGDLALVVNTVDDTVYLAGAVLPLATLKVEIPLNKSAPFYLRLGMEELDLSDAIDELSHSPVVSQALVTGMVELFVEKDFSRYQLLSYLTKLEIDTLGRTINNRGPLVFGLNNGEVLQIQQATIGTGDRYVSVEGALVTDPVLLDLRLDGQVDLSMLNTLRRAIPDAFPAAFIESTGALEVDASFRGAPDALIADGRVGFRNTEVAVRGLSDPVRVESGEIQLGRERVFITEDKPLSGSALGGVFSVAGELGFEGRRPKALDLRAWSHNMNYRVPNAANLTFDTDVRLEASDIMSPETWLISGNVDVLDGNFYRNISLFEQEVTGRVMGAFNRRTERYEASIFDQVPALEDIRFDLGIRARDGFVVRNEIDRLGLDLELRVDVRLQDTLLEPYVTGDVEVVDGLVGFQGEEFRVRSGTVRFSGEPSNPWIDVSAGADIRNRCREDQLAEEFQTDMTLSGDLNDNEEQYYHVMLNLQGYADNLDIQFESNPYADQRDILSLLLTGCTVDQLTASSASGPTLEIALGPLLGRIEKEIQDVVKVSEFTIMPGVERTQVRIGDRLTRRLSWNFQLDTGMSETAGGQRSQLEYKLSDRWSAELSGERNQTETNNFLLDLKLKYRLPLD